MVEPRCIFIVGVIFCCCGWCGRLWYCCSSHHLIFQLLLNIFSASSSSNFFNWISQSVFFHLFGVTSKSNRKIAFMWFFVKYLSPVSARLYILVSSCSTGYRPSFSPSALFFIYNFWISYTIPTDNASLVLWFMRLRRYVSFTKQECDFTCPRLSSLALAAYFKFTPSPTTGIMFPSSNRWYSTRIRSFWCFFVGDLMWTASENLCSLCLLWYLCCRMPTIWFNNVLPFIPGIGGR